MKCYPIINELSLLICFLYPCLGASGSGTDGTNPGFSASTDCRQYTSQPTTAVWQVYISFLMFCLCRTKDFSHFLELSVYFLNDFLFFSLSSWTSEMWMALGADPIVANQIMEMVMEKLLIMAPYVDQRDSMMRGGTTKVATNQPLAVSLKLNTSYCIKLEIKIQIYFILHNSPQHKYESNAIKGKCLSSKRGWFSYVCMCYCLFFASRWHVVSKSCY